MPLLPRLLLACLAFLALSCGDETDPSRSDTIPPAAVTDLLAQARSESSVVLRWTAPGDDGNEGRAARYDVRYAPDATTLDDWWDTAAVPVEIATVPGPPGAPEELVVSELVPDSAYVFRLRTFDEAGNGSALSNIARVELESPRPPAIRDLAASVVTSSWIELTWSVPAPDPVRAVAYELRWSLVEIDEATWEEATPVPGLPTPPAEGGSETWRWEGREASRTYHLAMRTRDLEGRLSRLEAGLVVSTPSISLVREGQTQRFPQLRDAIAAARDGEVIELDGGTFNGPGLRDVVVEGKSITLRRRLAANEACVLDLEGAGRALVLQGEGGSGSVIQGLTFRNGLAGTGSLYGGAVACFSSSPAFVSCRFEGNQARDYGGAIALVTGSDARFEGCVFLGNAAGVVGGGAVFASASSPTFFECEFEGNTAAGSGGAVSITGGSPRVEGCLFRANEAGDRGGALRLSGTAGSCRLTGFEENEAQVGGGAIYAAGAASTTFESCGFRSNVGGSWGGAVYLSDGAAPAFSLGTFRGNQALRGGALVAFSGARARLTRCTLAANEAESGGALRAEDPESGFEVDRSILAFQGRGGSVRCLLGATIELSCTNVFGNEGGDWIGCIAGQAAERNNLTVDPAFCDPTLDLRLRLSSPCADAPGCGTIGSGTVGCVP